MLGGSQRSLEPTVLLKIGLAGPLVYLRQTASLLRYGTVVETIEQIMTVAFTAPEKSGCRNLATGILGVTAAGAAAGAAAGVGATAGVGAAILGGIVALSMPIYLVIFLTWPATEGGTLAPSGLGTVVMFLAMVGAVAGFVVLNGAAVGTGMLVAQILLNYSIVAWLDLDPKWKRWPRYFAIFAFPFFCWLPVTVMLVTLLARRLHLPTMAICVAWLVAALAVTLLWLRGRTLENRACNPLRDIFSFDDNRRN